MVIIKVLIAGSAFFAAALAQGVAFTEWPKSLTAGQPVTLKWIGDGGAPVTLTLRKGPSTALTDVETISNDATNGEFTWTPSPELENGSDYAFQISQGDQVNYSGLVPLSGGSDTPPPSPASASGLQSDTIAAAVSSATMAPVPESATSGINRAMTTLAPSLTDSAVTSESGFMTEAPVTSSDASETNSESSETATPSMVAHPSLMNTPFKGANDEASATASASPTVHTGAATARVTVPVFLGVASAALLWLVQ